MPAGAAAAPDPVIAAGRRHRLRPATPRFNGGLGTRLLPPEVHVRPARRRGASPPCCRSATSSTRRRARRVPAVLRPDLGAGEAITHPALATTSTSTTGRARLLRLLQRRRQPTGPAGDRDQGLLQLRHRRLAPDRAQLELLAASAAAAPARRRSTGCGPTSPPPERAARSPTGTTRASAPASTATTASMEPTSGRRSTTRAPTSCSTATTTTTSASRRRRRRRRRLRARHPRVRGRHGRQEPLRLQHRPNSQVRAVVWSAGAHAPPEGLRLAIRARGR